MGDMKDSKGNLVAGSASLSSKAQEETEASKARKRADAWSSAYFKHLGVGTGLGGAAAIEKYKTANPGWEKGRDAWAQGQSKASAAKKAQELAGKVKAGTGTIGGLISQE